MHARIAERIAIESGITANDVVLEAEVGIDVAFVLVMAGDDAAAVGENDFALAVAMRKVAEEAERQPRPDAIVTTEKDWIRLQRWVGNGERWTIPVWVLQVQMTLSSGEDELDRRLACL